MRASLHVTISVSAVMLFLLNLSAQTSNLGKIRGSVVDETTNQPMESVDVILYRKTDSTIVTGTITDRKGRLELSNIGTGEYFLKFSILGYAERMTPVFLIDAQHKRLNLGNISLHESTVNLEEVDIVADKPLFNYSIGQKVYNVDQDIMSKSGSASEILQNIPSIKVEIDGKVSLRGSTNVVIMVNGKTSPLMDKNSAAYLEQLPASAVEKIAVITNPSAKYKANGKSGIINIVLKKNTALGLNGNVTVHGGTNGRSNGNFRLNYNPGNFNVFGSLSLRRDYRNRTDVDARLWEIPNGTSVSTFSYDQSIFELARPNSSTGNLGMDYHLDDFNSVGLSGNYFHHGYTGVDTSRKIFEDAHNVILREYDTDRSGYQFENEYDVTTYFRHSFAKDEHKLRFDFTASGSPKQTDNNFTTVYLLPENPPRYDYSVVRDNDHRQQVSVEYSNPITDRSVLEAGYEGEFNQEEMSLSSEFLTAVQQQFTRDTIKSYDFLFDESVHATYVTYKQTFGNFEFLGGLRAERGTRRSDLVTRDTTIARDDFSFFPSLHVSYRFSNLTEVQLSYSRRTNRPRAKDLNPFYEYRDARTIFGGNPDLLPEYIHSLELGAEFQAEHFSILPTVYYRYTYNRMTSIRRALNRFTLLTTKENLQNDESLGLEMVLSITASRVFSAHFSTNAVYDEISAPDIDFLQNRIIRSMSTALTCNLNFAKGSRFQISSHYNSSRQTAQGTYQPNNVVNMGIRQELFDGQLSLSLTVSDVFKTLKRELDLEAPPLHQSVINTRDSRIIYLGFTYRVGILPKKFKEENWHYEDEF